VSAPDLSRPQLFSYGILGLPLAMAALPIYVHVPKYYADTLGLDLAVVGFVLLGLRLLDCLVDPLLGAWSDRSGARAQLIAWSLPVLALGMIALFAPPVAGSSALAWWLAGTLTVVYGAYSLATINHQAWGAELSTDPHQRTRITATREGLALAGVMAAAVIPGLFADGAYGLRVLSWLFAAVLLVCGGWTVWRAPRPPRAASATLDVLHSLPAVLRVPAFRRLLAVYMINGIAAAIPATLVLFFIKDVIGAEARQGWFLGLYFLAGALAMPFWVALAHRIGKGQAWLTAMAVAIVAFVWASRLGPGDTMSFLVICAASGIALSADLALPPSLLADAIDQGPQDLGAGAYFGLWTLATKLNLALAAGIALPLVQWLGYRPGAATTGGIVALAIVYAGVPCVLKLVAVGLAWNNLVRRHSRAGFATAPPPLVPAAPLSLSKEHIDAN
jgi:Na+/melibiose symporter-like transporter